MFEYAASSWFCGTNQTIRKKLQISQNKMVRFIKNLGPQTHIGAEQISSVRLLNVKDRIEFLRLNHVHKIYQTKNAPYLSDNFCRVSLTHKYNTRGSQYNFVVPNVKGAASSTFYSTAIKEWNALPEYIKAISNINNFKIELKKYNIK